MVWTKRNHFKAECTVLGTRGSRLRPRCEVLRDPSGRLLVDADVPRFEVHLGLEIKMERQGLGP